MTDIICLHAFVSGVVAKSHHQVEASVCLGITSNVINYYHEYVATLSTTRQVRHIVNNFILPCYVYLIRSEFSCRKAYVE